MNIRTLGLSIAAVTVVSVLIYAFILVAAEGETGAMAPENMETYGAAFDLAAEPLPVAQVATHPADYAGQTVLVEGEITQVCQVKGCWLMLHNEAGGPSVRVEVPRADGAYIYTFAKDIPAGTRAILAGTIAVDTLSVDYLRHLAEDEGQTEAQIAAITEPQVAPVLTATGALVEKKKLPA